MCDDLKNFCRICLDVKSDHVSILDNSTIHLHMKSCLSMNISPNDHLPKYICVACVSQLSEFYNFQLNARCSQDWLESSIQEKSKKFNETKTQIQPLPDSEYNSDSLLEFLNNTANIEDYLNNLGKEDIPSIVNMFDRNEVSVDFIKVNKQSKMSPQKKDIDKTKKLKMEVDVLDSDIEIVQELLLKETDPKNKIVAIIDKNVDKVQNNTCFACKSKFENMHNLCQHISICEYANRTCLYCNKLFDSKQKMQEHAIIHNNTLSLLTCMCGKKFENKDKLTQHHKVCHIDYAAILGCMYRCKQCGEMFQERFQLYKHVKVHVAKAEEKVCDICGHSFAGDDALVKHRNEEHKKSKNEMYRCKICNITSSNHKEIYIHVQKHTMRSEPSRHLCESCGRSFATHTTLMRHSLQHRHVCYSCTVCNKKFPDEKVRDKHLLQHNEVAICDRCGQTVNSCKLEAHCCV